jgi:hypothetical protein
VNDGDAADSRRNLPVGTILGCTGWSAAARQRRHSQLVVSPRGSLLIQVPEVQAGTWLGISRKVEGRNQNCRASHSTDSGGTRECSNREQGEDSSAGVLGHQRVGVDWPLEKRAVGVLVRSMGGDSCWRVVGSLACLCLHHDPEGYGRRRLTAGHTSRRKPLNSQCIRNRRTQTLLGEKPVDAEPVRPIGQMSHMSSLATGQQGV